MPNTPKKNLPYPADTGRVMDGADAIEQLAVAVDNLPIVKAATVSINLDANNRATVTFPAAFPTSCAAVVVDQGGTFNAPFGPIGPWMVESINTTGFTVRASTGNLTGVQLRYVAVGA